MLEKLLSGEIELADTLLSELLHHLGLGGDGGMVGAWCPKGIFPLHTRTAYEDILYRVVEHVAHMEHTRHIWRRDDYRVGFATVGHRLKQVVRHPIIIPFPLYFRRAVFGSKLIHTLLSI